MNKVYEGIHWSVRKALADVYHSEFLEFKGKIKVKKYPVVIYYDWHFIKNPLDTLNCALMAKMLEDGMVRAGILEDDSTKYVRRSILDSQKTTVYKKDTVVISIDGL